MSDSDDLTTLQIKKDVSLETTPLQESIETVQTIFETVDDYISQLFQKKDAATVLVELDEKLDTATIKKSDEASVLKMLKEIEADVGKLETKVDKLVGKVKPASIEAGSQNEEVVGAILGKLHGMVEQTQKLYQKLEEKLSAGNNPSGNRSPSGSGGKSPRGDDGDDPWKWLKALLKRIIAWCSQMIRKLFSIAKKIIPLIKMTASTAAYLIYLINFFTGGGFGGGGFHGGVLAS